jgi:hypothetical protein
MRAKATKLLTRSTEEAVRGTGTGNAEFCMILKAQATKEKISKLNHSEVEIRYASKDHINRLKRQPTEWEKILASHPSVKEYLECIWNSTMKPII